MRQLGPATGEPHYLRASLEQLGLLAIGTAQYWSAASANSRDWDFPRWSERLSWKNIRFDNNTHVTNNLLHPLGGASYYAMARGNGISVGESALYAQVSSALWEWGLEWREMISINDMITTTAAGTAVGEFWVQLAAYLNSAPGPSNWARDAAKVTLGLPVWLHDTLDERRPDPGVARDALGFSSEYHHRFTLDARSTWADDAAERRQSMGGIALSAELSSLRGYRTPRSFSRAFAEGNFSAAALDLQLDGGELTEADFEADAVLAGYYTQAAGPGVRGLMLGLGTGLKFVDRDTLDYLDRYALAHLTGPQLHAFWTRGEFDLELWARGYADFAVLQALAWPRVRERGLTALPPPQYESALEVEGYQYHLGLSTRLHARLRLHSLTLSAEQMYGAYRSIEGLDRLEQEIARRAEGTEVLDERRVTLAIEPPETWLRFYVGIERLSHESVLSGLGAGRLERRLVAGGGLVF